ncbi:hypothetical protein pp309_000025 [Proteus phage 309]|uniref:Uncharacterized protein n=1 Tax=Proteus phage 309 TaxID=2894355 RepID=A0AAE9C803_9CAUD|nr:hypothetical protein pp309_000025 [Proteus phage 309]
MKQFLVVFIAVLGEEMMPSIVVTADGWRGALIAADIIDNDEYKILDEDNTYEDRRCTLYCTVTV